MCETIWRTYVNSTKGTKDGSVVTTLRRIKSDRCRIQRVGLVLVEGVIFVLRIKEKNSIVKNE